MEKLVEGVDGERRSGAILARLVASFKQRADKRSLPGIAFNQPAREWTCDRSRFLGFHAGLMETFERGEEACSARRAAGGAFGRRVASMAEAVRGHVRSEPFSMWSGALYIDMNACS